MRKFAVLTTVAVLSVLTNAPTTHAQNPNRPRTERQHRKGLNRKGLNRKHITKKQRIANWLSQQDSNKDGKIVLSESSRLMKKNFHRIDTNGDGFVNKEELGDLADDKQVMERVPDGVTIELNLNYREGNNAWKLDLARPSKESDRPRPAIVFIHGGGWVKGDKRSGPFLDYALQYATKGYVCVTVNYRLVPAKLPCIEDVKCAVRWLRAHAKKYNIDPNRIGAYGNSAGAHLATMLGVSHTDKRLEGDGPWQDFSSAVQAVVASATPTTPSVRGGLDFDIELIQPMSYVSSDAPPMLLVHEESDRVVPISNSDDFVKALKESAAKDINYKRYTDGSGHAVFLRNAKETAPAMEAFFARTIGK